MKKKAGYLTAVLVGVMLVGTITYTVVKNTKEEKSKQQENFKDSITLKETKKEGDKVTQSFNINLNGKQKVLNIEYTIETQNFSDSDYITNVTGKFGNYIFYNRLTETEHENFKKENFTEDNLKNALTEKNFRFIKGENDSTYLLIITENEVYNGFENDLYILNDELEIITGDMSYDPCYGNASMVIRTTLVDYKLDEEGEQNKYYDTLKVCDNDFNNFSCNINVKIEDNKIYYLKVKDIDILNSIENEKMGTMEERIYTINNNNLTYSVKKTYGILNGSGQAC